MRVPDETLPEFGARVAIETIDTVALVLIDTYGPADALRVCAKEIRANAKNKGVGGIKELRAIAAAVGWTTICSAVASKTGAGQ